MTPRKGYRILSICDDEGIRVSREMVLRQEGYETESFSGLAPLTPEKIRSFHIAILCHTLNAARAAQMAVKLHGDNPSIRILRVHSIRSRSDGYYDADCEVLAGPSALLSAIRTLCEQFTRPNEAIQARSA